MKREGSDKIPDWKSRFGTPSISRIALGFNAFLYPLARSAEINSPYLPLNNSATIGGETSHSPRRVDIVRPFVSESPSVYSRGSHLSEGSIASSLMRGGGRWGEGRREMSRPSSRILRITSASARVIEFGAPTK